MSLEMRSLGARALWERPYRKQLLAIRAAVGTIARTIASKLAPTISPYPATKQPGRRTCQHKLRG